MVEIGTDGQHAQIIIRPNCSSSWQSNRRIIAAIFSVNALFASGFIASGAWLVLPFMGFELTALWLVLRRVFQRLQIQQVVRLNGQELRIESGYFRAERSWRWPQQASSVLVTQCPHPWDPLRISLSHSGEYVVIGQFLNRDDSRRLLDALRDSGLPIRQFGSDGTLAA
ncbi:DUF2244 domain-containing protein [Spongiibacter nanhainus]|uniref:DUF2244 domain-containing protein n=1 Tax=Spongiibacter nanhainus TaxID=2794344 RepID=A0A7T4QYD6_9GAMM|nr:DUF2244 domain-containing protein [Spongiibacter nanhainus]QQD16962.1 DUF2244 domain-containing protein [Spongiibacter nanhainus]